MSFSKSLQALTDEDLSILLSRRAEAAELAAHPRPRWGDLATTLLRPRAVVPTLARLDRFLAQVLQLACLEGGRLGASVAAREGLAPTDLERAARELCRWGLARREDDGELLVPPVVVSLVGDPAGLGRPLAWLLDHLLAEELRQIAIRHGIDGRYLPKRKHELVDALHERLADPDRMRELVRSAPPSAQGALESLRRAGGTTRGHTAGRPWSEHMYSLWTTYGYGPERRDDGVNWLIDRGLVLPEDVERSVATIPAEVERALRGRVFARWEATPPALKLRVLEEKTHPADLLAAVETVLETWRHAPPAALKDGGAPKREIKKIGQRIGRSDDEAAWLVELADAAGLLGEREVVPEKRSRSWRHPQVLQSRRAVIEPSDDADRWLDLPEAPRWLELARVWRRLTVSGTDPVPQLLLGLLGEAPEGRGASAASLGALLAWRHPVYFSDAAHAATVAGALGRALEALGAGSAAPVVGLSALGRAVLLSERMDDAALARAFPASAEGCVVTADHRVVVSGPPSGDLARVLRGIAEVESARPARVYRITTASLARGLDGGLTAAAIVEALRSHASAPVPAVVVTFIEDVARRHGRVRVGAAEVYVVTDDPAQLEQVVRARGIGEGLRRISPTVAVVDGHSADEVVTALRRAGLMPVADGSPPATPVRRPKAAAGRDDLARAAPVPATAARPAALDRAAADRLIAALRASRPGGDGPATEPSPEEGVRVALAEAARRHQPIEIGYRGATGALEILTVLPYSLLREEVWVQDPRRFGSYKLELRRIPWVEPVQPGPGVSAGVS